MFEILQKFSVGRVNPTRVGTTYASYTSFQLFSCQQQKLGFLFNSDYVLEIIFIRPFLCIHNYVCTVHTCCANYCTYMQRSHCLLCHYVCEHAVFMYNYLIMYVQYIQCITTYMQRSYCLLYNYVCQRTIMYVSMLLVCQCVTYIYNNGILYILYIQKLPDTCICECMYA